MADIGDKAFTTELVQEIKAAVLSELGSNAYVKRNLATVQAVNTTTSEISVYLSGSDQISGGFYARGLQLPIVGDSVIACIDGQDKWIESVVRPSTSTPYLQISSGALVGAGAPTGAIVAWLTTTAPSGWLFCDGSTKNYNDYPALGALRGASAGGTFTTPDLRERFIAANALVTTAWTNNTGSIKPNVAFSTASHTHTGPSHSHTFTGAAHSHDIGSHTHDVAGTSGAAGTGSTQNVPTSGTGVVAIPNTAHTHSSGTYAASTTTATSASATAGGSNSSDGTGATGGTAATIGTTYASLLNFIIKT